MKCGRGRQSGRSPCSQWTPVLPGGQVQLPVTGSQAAPCPHLHTWAQPGPKRPCGQAAGRKQDGGHSCRLPFPLPCQSGDRMGCGDLPCPCPPWHLPSTRSSAGGQASSAGTGTPCYPHPTAPSRSRLPDRQEVPHDSETGALLGGMPSGPPSAQRCTSACWTWPGQGIGGGGGDRAGWQGHWGHTDIPTLAQPGVRPSRRIRKLDGQGAVLPQAGWGALPTEAQGAATLSLPHSPRPPPSHSRRLQSAPRNPAGQRQAPVAASQEPPWRHPHCCSQPGPNRPGGHPAGTGAGARGQGPGLAPLASHPQPWDEQRLLRTA